MSDYIEALGIIAPKAVYKNLTPAQLVEHALRRGEGTLSNTGALVVKTGKALPVLMSSIICPCALLTSLPARTYSSISCLSVLPRSSSRTSFPASP